MFGSRSSSAGVVRLATIALILFSTSASDSPRGAAPPYTVIDLGTFGTAQTGQAFDLTDSGRVVGTASSRAFLWQNGTKANLGALGSGSAASASGVNEAGQVVGYAALTTPPSGYHAVLWNNGSIVDLTPELPLNEAAAATAINESGQVVANITYGTAFLWQNGTRTPLGHLGGGVSAATDINDNGVIVGGSYNDQMTPLGLMQRPFVWQNGVMTDLGLLAGDDDGSAQAINNAGQIVGASGRMDPDTYEAFYRAFIHANGVMTALPVPSWEAYASDINDAGVVVGTMRAGGAVTKYHGWIYVDGIVTNLNTLIPAGTGLHIAYANAINNAGQIAATAYDAQGRLHAVLLNPGEGPAPTPTVSIADVSVTEGDTGTRIAVLNLTISPMSTGAVTVNYSTANGSAVAGIDYDAAGGTLTIPAGRTSWAVGITVRADRKREPDEVFFVNLSNAVGATITDAQGVGTIRNDDK
jgi:probable HAF family extracellular repeat protein